MIRFLSASLLLIIWSSVVADGQTYPWQSPLLMATSSDGISFGSPAIYQDSAGVPSLIRWKGDTLVCAFQWFRQPIGSSSWDRVAVKFSYDDGLTWTDPLPVIMNGLPGNYQRPFDPTLVAMSRDSLRMYFSSSVGIPSAGLDSTINTYSAISTDGIHYFFEPIPRVDEPGNRVIDPAVIRFNQSFHYLSPIGSPQDGAYHYVSPDGLIFSKVADIPSDNQHNWTGNYMVNDSSELRFYGCGATPIWYKASPNGGTWSGYVNTNLQGGDPSVIRLSANRYLMVFVGTPIPAGISELNLDKHDIQIIFPNPVSHYLTIPEYIHELPKEHSLIDSTGKIVLQRKLEISDGRIDVSALSPGLYWLVINEKYFRFMKE